MKKYIDWDITKKCNLKCSYCLRGSIVDGEGSDIEYSEELVDDIMKKMRKLEINRAILGGGEPLLCKQLPMIIGRLKDNKIESWLTTNATLLDSTISKQLIENGLDIISFSIDSAIPEKHDMQRGKGSFDAAISGIRSFIVECENTVYDTIPLIGFSITITRDSIDNEDDIIMLLNLAQELSIDEVQFNFSLPVGQGKVYAENVDGQYRVRISEYIASQSIRYKDIAIRIGTGGGPLLNDYLLERFPDSAIDSTIMPCPAGIEMFFLSQSLEIYPCSIICDKDFALGLIQKYIKYNPQDNYYKNVDIKSNTYFRQFSIIRSKFEQDVYKPCSDCKYLKSCHSVCRMHWISRTEKENIDTYIPQCIYLIEEKGVQYKRNGNS